MDEVTGRAEGAGNSDAAAYALDGLRVVSMAEQYPGPFCTLILSDMGADVIQVERPGTGDPSRFLAAFYESLNRGKRSVALDIRVAKDKARLLDLIRSADVFLEGFRPGKLARQGFGYDDLKRINPGLIYCSISGYGQNGPYRDRPGHDITFQGIGGALDERIDGRVSGTPPALLLGDSASALYATIGVLAALNARSRTGRGTHIDIAMADSVLALQTAFVTRDEDDAPPPQAEPGYDLFVCADGRHLTLSIAHEDAYWHALCETLELNRLADLPRAERVAQRAKIRLDIADAISRKPFSHWQSAFEESDQMWGPAHRLPETLGDPHFLARGLIGELRRADGRRQSVLRQPVKFSSYRQAPLYRAPTLGEHPTAGFE